MSAEENDLAAAAAGRGKMPSKIGKYSIIREVGRGSSGTVYLSHDPFYGRDVAIKLYKEPSGEDEAELQVARKMFFNEAQMVGRLQHPNILPIYDAGEEDGRYYVVMEHVHGARTLSAYCRPDNLLPIEEVVRVIFNTVRAMHYAHTRGVVHRDIKPSNIMLTMANEVRVIDFGIAVCVDTEVSVIRGVAGSPSYMSPEQIKAEEIGPRSDLYALGAVAYELLTGRRPFKASNLAKLLHQIVFATPHPIHKLRPEVPEELEEVVWRAMRKKPEDRYSNGLEFAAALTRIHQTLRNTRSSRASRSCGGCAFFTTSRTPRSASFSRLPSGASMPPCRTSCARARWTIVSTSSCAATWLSRSTASSLGSSLRATVSVSPAWCPTHAARQPSARSSRSLCCR